MTLIDFIVMDEMEQQEVLRKGVHVGDRFDAEHNILLFQFDNFYVEAFYHKKFNFIRRYRPFTSVELLEPYLGQIDISSIVVELH